MLNLPQDLVGKTENINMREKKRAGNLFHKVLRMYFSDSKLVTRSKRQCLIQEIRIQIKKLHIPNKSRLQNALVITDSMNITESWHETQCLTNSAFTLGTLRTLLPLGVDSGSTFPVT